MFNVQINNHYRLKDIKAIALPFGSVSIVAIGDVSTATSTRWLDIQSYGQLLIYHSCPNSWQEGNHTKEDILNAEISLVGFTTSLFKDLTIST